MLQQETILSVADNSGAKKVKLVKVLGGSRRRYATVGDIVVCSIREAAPRGNVKKGDVCKGVIVRTRRQVRRRDGTCLSFDTNAIVLIDDKMMPRGSRVFGSVAREVHEKFPAIASLAQEVI